MQRAMHTRGKQIRGERPIKYPKITQARNAYTLSRYADKNRCFGSCRKIALVQLGSLIILVASRGEKTLRYFRPLVLGL